MIATPIKQSFLTSGLLYQQYSPNIHAFSCNNTSNEVVDIVYEKLIELDQQAATKNYHIGYLFVLDNVQYTPYILHKISQAISQMPEGQIESTAVVADSFLMSVLKQLVLPFVDEKAAQSTLFFTTEREALEWLNQRAKTFDS